MSTQADQILHTVPQKWHFGVSKSLPHSDPGAGWPHPVPAMHRQQDQKGWNSKGPSQAAARPSPTSGAAAAVLSPARMGVTQGAPPTLPGSLTLWGQRAGDV